MMSKLKVMPVLLSAIIVSILLFGGYYLYNRQAVEAPLEQKIAKVEGVVLKDATWSSQKLTVSLQLSDNVPFAQAYGDISQVVAEVAGAREWQILIDGETSPRLEEAYRSQLFTLAELMDAKEYTRIPEVINKIQAAFPGVEAAADMDASNVYITLKDASGIKYIVLPRESAKLGAWSRA